MKILSSDINARFLAYQLQFLHSFLFFDYTMKAHPSVIKDLYTIMIPTIKEQQAIAKFLSDMDNDIESSISQRDKYKLIKQGMMQQLLTGKIRLQATA